MPDGGEGSELAQGLAAELADAFGAGPGPGLFALAGRLPTAALAPVEAYWRDFAKLGLGQVLAAGAAELTPALVAAWQGRAPAMPGGEYLTEDAVRSLWAALMQTTTAQPTLQETLATLHKAWDGLGRVCLSLAENRRDPDKPFALLATYTTRLGGAAKPQHAPLGRVLKDQAARGHTEGVAKITARLREAAERSAFMKELLDSQRLFQPQALTVAEAYRFLQDLPRFEEAGLVVRVPDWWDPDHPPRPRVAVTVGAEKPKEGGLGGFVDFKADLSLLGQPLTPEEWKKLRDAADGLVFLRGQWVEADPEQIQKVLDAWQHMEALATQQGVPFALAMRILVGGGPTVQGNAEAPVLSDDVRPWSEVAAGPWMKEALAALRHPETSAPPPLADAVRATLRPYQTAGVAWLWRLHTLGLGGCLADDMGLGKTLQVLSYLAALKVGGVAKAPHLIVAPATLLGNWAAEAAKFTPGLRVLVAHPSQQPQSLLRDGPRDLAGLDLVVTSYGSLLRYPWLRETSWHAAVLDEAQAIKNPDTQQTRAVKELKARHRVALTGTPIENKPLDLWSLFDFVNPGLLGSARDFSAFIKGDEGAPRAGAYAQLRSLVRPYILRRLKTDRTIAPDLPDKTELEVTCALTPAQAALYERIVDDLKKELASSEGIKRKGVVLASLLKLKQVCDHPSLVAGHGEFAPRGSGKMLRLLDIADEIAQRQEKLLVFTQFREMTAALDRELARVFGRSGCVLHGETPIKERQALVQRFQAEGGPPYFVLSVKAGGTGLTLTAASHVVHFDRWWNPAVEDQATDRAYRIGQHRNVLVHKLSSAGTVEEKIAKLIAGKRGLARELLSSEGGEVLLTELGDEELLELVSLDMTKAKIEP